MTLNDLIRMLKVRVKDNPTLGDREVYAVSDYGDYHHTLQLIELDEMSEGFAKETAYSDSGLCYCEDGVDEDTYDDDDSRPQILVLHDGRKIE